MGTDKEEPRRGREGERERTWLRKEEMMIEGAIFSSLILIEG